MKRWAALMALGFLIALVGFSALAAPRLEMDVYLRYTPIALLIGILGIAIVVYGIRGLLRAVLAAFLPRKPEEVSEIYLRSRSLLRGPRIVVLGGGTGMPVLLRGLKAYTANITAIVTSADDGGSSGRLRSELGVLPPGDVRNCLLALAETEPLLERLFQYRFDSGRGLEGHAFGNLFLAAMERITGDFQEAIVESSRVLAVRGRVLAATREAVTLVAQTEDGTWVRGESAIPRFGRAIRRLRLDPPAPHTAPEVVAAIREAEAVVISPGSLFTSILPVLLVPKVAEAIRQVRGPRIYVQNLMTQPGETDGMDTLDHVKAVEAHAPGVVDWIVQNATTLSPEVLARYREEGAAPVTASRDAVRESGKRLVETALLADGPLVRHDPDRLARAVLGIVVEAASGFDPRRRIDLFFLAERLRRAGRTG